MATIVENITIIKNSIDRMKEALNLPSNTPLENLTLAVEDGGGSSGGGSTVYKVATLEERDALSAKEGDICLVHNIEEFNCDGTKFGNTLVFPETIVSPTAITSSSSFTFMYGANAQDYTRRLSVIVAPTYFRASNYQNNEQIAYYQSTDGITYNRTTDYEEYVFENTLFKQYASQTISANLTPFLLMKNVNMEGLFQFKTDTWEYLDIGVTGEASNVLLNIKSYTNEGTITGTRDMTKYRDDLIKIQDTEPEDKLGLWLRLKPDVTATYSQNTLAILPGSLNENPATQLPDITKIISTSNPYTTTYKYNGNWQYDGDGFLHGNLYYTHNNGKAYTSRCIKIGDYLYTFPTNDNTLTDNSNTLVEKINLNTLEVTSLANFPIANKYLFAVPIYDGNDIISLACPIYREADDDQYIVSYIYLYSISNNKWTTVSVSSSNRVDYAGVKLIKDGYAYIEYYDTSKTVLARYNLTTGAVSSTSISIPSSEGYYNYVDGGNGYLYNSGGYKYSKATFERTALKTTSTVNKIISYENSGNILTLWTFDKSYNLVRITIDKDTDDVIYDTIKLDWTNKVAKDINHAFTCEFNGDFILLGGCDRTDGTISYKSYKISKDSIDYSKPFDMRKPLASSNKGTIVRLFTDYNKGKEVSITLHNKIYLTDVYYSSNNYENNYISEVYIGDGKTYTLFKTYE